MQTQPDRNSIVGYVVSTWPRLSQTFVLNEILALERMGLPICIYSTKDPDGEPVHADIAQVRAEVIYLSAGSHWMQIVLANLRLALIRPVRYLKNVFRAVCYRRGTARHFFQAVYLANLLRRAPVGHLHAHFATGPALVAMFTSWLTGIPYSFTAHARDIYVDTQPELLRAEMEHARAVITVSHYNRDYLLRHISPASNARVRCVYNGLDLSQFPFRSPREMDLGPPVILSVARLIEKKGFRDLIEACSLLEERGRSFQLEIIGAGPLRPVLEAQIERLRLNNRVRLLGAQPQEIVRRAYQRASIFVLPCVIAADGDRDGIPTALLEAMASGTPVISTPVSGVPEVITSERNGILIQPGDPVMLADALDKLLADSQLRNRLARAARVNVEKRFTIDRSARQLLTLFQGGGDASFV